MKFRIARFAIVGIFSTLVDLGIYAISLALLPGNYWEAKAIGFLAGTLTGFFINRNWTFQHGGSITKSILKYLGLYLATLALNVTTNSMLILALGSSLEIKTLAFLVATALSAMVNFLAIKRFVFVEPS